MLHKEIKPSKKSSIIMVETKMRWVERNSCTAHGSVKTKISPLYSILFLLLQYNCSFLYCQIHPFEPSAELDSLYESIYHLNSMFCHDDKGKLISFEDAQCVIELEKGKITSISSKDSVWSIVSDGSELTIRTDSNLYSVTPLGKDMLFQSSNTNVISTLDTLNHKKKHNSVSSNRHNPREVDILLKLDHHILTTGFDTISGLMKRTAIHFSSHSRLELVQSYFNAGFYQIRYTDRNAKYAIDIWYNRHGVIDDVISYNLKDESGFTLSFYGKRWSRRINRIEYFPELMDRSKGVVVWIHYPVYRYRKSGRLKDHKIKVNRCD